MSVPVSEFNCLQFKLDKSHCNAMLEKMVPRRAFLSDPIRSVGRQPVTNLVLNDVKIFIINHYQRCVQLFVVKKYIEMLNEVSYFLNLHI